MTREHNGERRRSVVQRRLSAMSTKLLCTLLLGCMMTLLQLSSHTADAQPAGNAAAAAAAPPPIFPPNVKPNLEDDGRAKWLQPATLESERAAAAAAAAAASVTTATTITDETKDAQTTTTAAAAAAPTSTTTTTPTATATATSQSTTRKGDPAAAAKPAATRTVPTTAAPQKKTKTTKQMKPAAVRTAAPSSSPSSPSSWSPPARGRPWPASRRRSLARAVREMFNHAFEGYLTHAFPHDELKPLSNTWTDSMAELGNARATAPSPKLTAANASKPYRGFALTLIDSLSTLAVLRDRETFCAGVAWVVAHTDFDVNVRLHVFESNIRLLAGLLSAHAIITDEIVGPELTEGVWYEPLRPASETKASPAAGSGNADGSDNKVLFVYDGGLLRLALDLGERLLKAFPSASGSASTSASSSSSSSASSPASSPGAASDPVSPLPYSFVHLQAGVLEGEGDESCTAAAGTLLLEFGLLSAFSGDMRFWHAADAAMGSLWGLRHSATGLFPATFSRASGVAIDPLTGTGAGVDSVFEYLSKSSIIFGTGRHADMAHLALEAAERNLRISVIYQAMDTSVYNSSKQIPARMVAAMTMGEAQAQAQAEPQTRNLHPSSPWSTQRSDETVVRAWYTEAHFASGQHVHYSFNSLSSFWPGLQVLFGGGSGSSGGVEDARESHASFFSIWESFGSLPERVSFLSGAIHPTERYYPLRPELAESTYVLHRATKDELFLDAAERIVRDINNSARTGSGFAGIRNCEPLDANANAATPLELEDRQQSFFLAETLKYLYLIFADDDDYGREGGEGCASHPHWMHRDHLPHRHGVGASSWILTTEGHPFPVRASIQSLFSDHEAVFEIARDDFFSAAAAGGTSTSTSSSSSSSGGGGGGGLRASKSAASKEPSDALLAWDAKRRFDARVAELGGSVADALKEVSLASEAGTLSPHLKRVLDAGAMLETGASSAATTSTPSDLAAALAHPLSPLFRFNTPAGLFHPALVSRSLDAATYKRDGWSYMVSRMLGEETALAGLSSTPALGPSSRPPPGSRPFDGRYIRSDSVPPMSVRDALTLPRRSVPHAHGSFLPAQVLPYRALSASQCPRHASMRGLSLGHAPRSFWHYDADWIRWQTKIRADQLRGQNYIAWQAAARKKAATAAAASAAATASQSSTAGANGLSMPLPSELLEFLQKQLGGVAEDAIAAAAAARSKGEVPPHLQGSPFSAEPGSSLPLHGGSGHGGSGSHGGAPIQAGDFVVESDAGAFLVMHIPSASSLTIRNLATDSLELINELHTPEGFKALSASSSAAAEPTAPGSNPSASSPSSSSSPSSPSPSGSIPPSGPAPRVSMLVVDGDSYVHSWFLSIARSAAAPAAAAGCVGRTIQAAGGHFGTIPPREDSRDAMQKETFLQRPPPPPSSSTSSTTATSFAAQSLLRELGEAGPAEAGQLTGFLVSLVGSSESSRSSSGSSSSSSSSSSSLGGVHPQCCDPIPHGSPAQQAIQGNIVMIERGGCTFIEKAVHLQAAGALGMVVWNSGAFQPNYLFVMGSDASDRPIFFPAVMIDDASGRFVQQCNEQHIAAAAAAAAGSSSSASSASAAATASRMVVTLRRSSFESGQAISVDPTPVFRSASASSSASSSAPSSAADRATVTFAGGVDHFSFQTMAGWTAEVHFDEAANNFQLTLY